ncbi:zeta toxin family protein (plasmid) [Nocardiopsis eucommiae]|uniref:UDP-N-acetylglucosamine kinase n=1 Tax=Nocardiopsis eucommiae TaxID=2831970 RepID=A0A975LD56_9ACTN|nr:zeta toxin family protein [Nocardiopsis eucommiae]
MKAAEFTLPEEDLDYIFDRPTNHPDQSPTVREFVFGPYPDNLETPTLVLVGGQPGAGKSRAMATVAQGRQEELVPLSGDDLRPFHPAFTRLAQDHPWLMPNATAQASGAWVRRCIDHALQNRYSLLLEGVFRNPHVVAQTIDRFAAAGYRVEVVGLAVPYRDSLLATLGRYLYPADTETARWTPATAHDSAYNMIPSTLQAAEDTAGTHQLHITNREGANLHTNTRTPHGQWTNPTPGAAVEATNSERNAAPSPEIARTWLELWAEHTRELAHRGQLNEQTAPTLTRLADQAQQAASIAYPHDHEARSTVTTHLRRLSQAPQDTPVELPPVRLPQ